MMFWKKPSSKKIENDKRDPAELSISTWFEAFNDRIDYQSTKELVLSSLSQVREKIHKSQFDNPKCSYFHINLPHGLQLVLDCEKLSTNLPPNQNLQTKFWQLKVNSCPSHAILPMFARRNKAIIPIRQRVDMAELWNASKRRWRDPREMSLPHWHSAIGLQRNIFERNLLATEISLLSRLYSIDWVFDYLNDPLNVDLITPTYLSDQMPHVLTDRILTLSASPAGLDSLKLMRSRSFGRQIVDMAVTDLIDLESFNLKLLNNLALDVSLMNLKKSLYKKMLISELKNPKYSKYKKYLVTHSEYSALISMGLMIKALNNRDNFALKSIFVANLNLNASRQFLTAIEKILMSRPRLGGFDKNEKIILELFLKSIGFLVNQHSELLKDITEFDGIFPLQFKQINNHQELISSNFSKIIKIKNNWIITGSIPVGFSKNIFFGNDPNVYICGVNNISKKSFENIKYMKNHRIPFYSAEEEELSAHTENISKHLINILRDIIGPHESQSWLEALELPLDDLLFKSTVDFWSVLKKLKENPNDENALVVGSQEMTLAYLSGIRSLNLSKPINIISPSIDNIADFHSHTFNRTALEYVFGKNDVENENAIREVLIKDLSIRSIESNNGKSNSLLIGRILDRNYNDDLRKLGVQLKKKRNVIYVPTAGKINKNQILTFFTTRHPAWRNKTFYDPVLALYSPINNKSNEVYEEVLSSIINRAKNNVSFKSEEVALLIYAAPQLNAFFGKRLSRHMKSGSMMSQIIKNNRPTNMALLPGRDYIARVAAFVGREQGILSFDVQTVFVGPRSRYKRTIADIQLTIETESKKIFKNYFGMDESKIIVTGCSKLDQVQKKARKLNSVITRDLIGKNDKYLLLFACSPILQADKAILEGLAQMLPSMPNLHLWIRQHPTAQTDYNDFVNMLITENPAIELVDHIALPESIISADVIITRFSNVGLEAALLGRDVISCNFDRSIMPIQFDKMGVSVISSSSQRLSEYLSDFSKKGPVWSNLQKSREEYLLKNTHFLKRPESLIVDTMENFIKIK